MSGKQRRIFILACLGMLLFGITLTMLGAVVPSIQQKFNLDAVSSGTLFSILPFGILAGSIIFGPFADRYGYKLILILACIGMFIGFQGIAYAPSLTLLKISVFFFGFGGGVMNGAANALVSDISDKNKKANLSLLGVFFAIGALGIPFLLGLLKEYFTLLGIVSSVGYLCLLLALALPFLTFPDAKQTERVTFEPALKLLRDEVFLFASFFLFCQSAFEAIIHNWTPTYLMRDDTVLFSNALYALSLNVVGMAAMRVLLGSVLRNLSSKIILLISMALMLAGTAIMHVAVTYVASVTGLILIGAGMAAGFPVMLAILGSLYSNFSATAFSVAMSIALIGNIFVNYGMGIVIEKYGIHHLTTVSFALTVVMTVLSLAILKKLKTETITLI